MLKKEAMGFSASCHLFEKSPPLDLLFSSTSCPQTKVTSLTFVILDIQYGVNCVRISIMRALRFSFLRLQQKMIPIMSKTSRAKPPMEQTTAISTVQSGGLGTVLGGKTREKSRRPKNPKNYDCKMLL